MYRIRQVATQGAQDGSGFVKTYFIRTFLKIWQYYTFKDSKVLQPYLLVIPYSAYTFIKSFIYLHIRLCIVLYCIVLY